MNPPQVKVDADFSQGLREAKARLKHLTDTAQGWIWPVSHLLSKAIEFLRTCRRTSGIRWLRPQGHAHQEAWDVFTMFLDGQPQGDDDLEAAWGLKDRLEG